MQFRHLAAELAELASANLLMLRKQKWNSNSMQSILEFELRRHILSPRWWQNQGQSA